MDIATTILELSEARGRDKTICPSAVARKLYPDEWRKHMKDIRKIAFLLRNTGKVIITQKGREVYEDEVAGPIRIRIS